MDQREPMSTPAYRAICAKIHEISYIGTARALGKTRASLGAYVSGSARTGSIMEIEARARELGWVDAPEPTKSDIEKIAKLMNTTVAEMRAKGVIR